MMTRETKAGLVVSCSFLCLVGIVLVSKLREAHNVDPSGEATDEALAQATKDPTPADETRSDATNALNIQSNSSTNLKNDKQPTVKDAHAQEGNHQPDNKVVPAAFPADGIATALNPPAIAQNKPTVASPPSLHRDNENAATALDDTAPVMEGGNDNKTNAISTQNATPSIAVMESTVKDKKASILHWVPQADKKKATSLQGMGLRRPEAADAAKLASQTGSGLGIVSDDATAAIGANRPKLEMPSPSALMPPTLSPKPDTQKIAAPTILGVRPAAPPGNPSATAAVGGLVATPASTPGKDDTAIGSLSSPKVDKSPTGGESPPSLTAPGQGNGTRPGLGAAVVPPSEAATDAERGVRLDAPVIAPANQAPQGQAGSLRTAPSSDLPSRTPLGTPVAAGGSTSATPQATVNTSSTSSAQVESYDEDTYTCKGSDTFRSISETVYRSSAYDQALLLFNRNHPLANDAVKQNPPLLQPGQPIYVPQLQILRKYYAASITEGGTASAARDATTGQSATGATLTAPVGGQATGQATGQPARTYRVGASGEMIRDIARRTLGSADRWADIYQLNRGLDPAYAIPAGTELRVPADARVDVQNP
jgi:hypothetical protein